MKILYVTEIYPDVKSGLGVWGGGEKQFYEISKRVAKRGHDAVVLTCRFPGQSREDFTEGVRVLRQGMSRDPRSGGARKAILPVLSYVLKTANKAIRTAPDIIHCNTYFPVYAGKVAAKLHNVPLVATFHDIYSLNNWVESQGSPFWGFLGHVTTIVAAKMPYHKIIVPTPQCRQKLIALGIDSKKLAIIPNGIDLPLFDSTRVEKENFQVLFVGRLTHLKRVDRLIHAFTSVLKQKPEAKLKIVGYGPEDGNLRRLVGKLRLQASVTFTGVTPTYDKVARYFKESAIFVLPSDAEGESIAVKEAMASNLPVIAMRIKGSGVLSLVEDGENGFLVEPSRIDILAERIIELLQDEKKRKAMGAASRRHVEGYDWRVAADHTLQLYQEVITQG